MWEFLIELLESIVETIVLLDWPGSKKDKTKGKK